MSPLVQITAVGALVMEEDSDRYRPKQRGDIVNLSQLDADRFVADNTGKLVDGRDPAPHAEAENPDGGAHDLDSMTVAELRKFADDRQIELSDGRSRALITRDITAAMADDPKDGGE